ncbi:hypothetical protein [Maritimibacter sp. DP1N21-5]|uniref:hypothetical protein n=1 Tax=Maritimibacter sp. DP1N21-5 TaxID=2836867 RepID=UPI001C455B4F|nr:hypothetical protein [Maritimibacter sp. DP1N21-5]MBV7410716.1 hypothetical protein [Maritimibacter sp. DP1N21-5]
MQKYFYFAPGRPLWFELAEKLSSKNVASPVFYLGDNTHMEAMSRSFPNCQVADFRDPLYGLNLNKQNVSTESLMPLRDSSITDIKDVCMKMMDRLDLFGCFRRVDREALFYNVALWASRLFDALTPNFLLFGEAPHSWPQYIFYRIAKLRNVKTLIFGQWSIAPALYLREEIMSAPVSRVRPDTFVSDDAVVDRVKEYFLDVDPSNFQVMSPDYMRQQEELVSGGGIKTFLRWARRVLRVALREKYKNMSYPLGSIEYISEKASEDVRGISGLALLSGHPDWSLRWASLIGQARRNKFLRDVLKENTGGDVGINFVYFPLHYEPERTTCPDGDLFHDQVRALIALRSTLPSDFQIVVKEHRSQISGALRGDLGRSPYFYEAITQIDNVILASVETPSEELIKDCAFVATISGTAALEAALLGRKALILGHVWFAGCPNVFSFGTETTLSDILEGSPRSRSEVEDWILGLYKRTAVPGFQNPSGLVRFKDFEDLDGFRDDELLGAFGLVESALHASGEGKA